MDVRAIRIEKWERKGHEFIKLYLTFSRRRHTGGGSSSYRDLQSGTEGLMGTPTMHRCARLARRLAAAAGDLDACGDERLSARVGVVISDDSDSGALRRARETGVRTAHLSSVTHADAAELDRAISDTLERANVDIVVLVGYP